MRLSAWDAWAYNNATTWDQQVKLRAFFATPVSRDNDGTRYGGIMLQTWARTLKLDRVGLRVTAILSCNPLPWNMGVSHIVLPDRNRYFPIFDSDHHPKKMQPK